MHIPDGFIDAPVSLAAGVIALIGIAICLRGARRQLDERTAPLAGLVAVFVFAMQMLNFPVAAGTSGHLLGGALAAILVGPYAGALAVSVVILVQGLLFADGGLSALGLNIINMGLITAVVGWFVFRFVIRIGGTSRPAVLSAAFIAGFVSVPVSALGFVVEYALGGTGTVSLGAVTLAMVGTHLLIGIGEGIITMLTVGAVFFARPDLVYGLHDRAVAAAQAGRRRAWGLVWAGLALSLLIAGVASYYASSSPDGLEKVAEDQGFLDQATTSANATLPTADYGVAGVSDARLSVGIAGVFGVVVLALIVFALFLLIARSRRGEPTPAHQHGHDVGERLYVHRHSFVHQLPPEVKTVAAVAFIFMVIATPNKAFWAFGVYAVLLLAVIAIARVPVSIILPRMIVEVPFLLFAAIMPFTGPAPTVTFLGMELSTVGLLAGWGIIVKGTLGVVTSILLAATTPARDLLLGLERMHVPQLLVQIASFMLRYVHVVGDEMHRMSLARQARGFEATGVRSWPVIAQSGGTLFIRSYERGERVHLAMLSRGYTGRIPELAPHHTTPRDWITALLLPLVGALVLIAARVMS